MGQRVHVLKNIFIKVTQAHWDKQNRATPLKTSMPSSLELGLRSLPLPGQRNFAGVMNEDNALALERVSGLPRWIQYNHKGSKMGREDSPRRS